jgi:hypothetical protein
MVSTLKIVNTKYCFHSFPFIAVRNIDKYFTFSDMEAYTLFKEKLIIGQHFELLAQKQLINYYNGKYNVTETCNDADYDFKLSNGKYYEVKYDNKACTTGNIFIETVQFNKPSGIDITKADYYIIALNSTNYFNTDKYLFLKIRTSKLRKLIKKELYDKYYVDKN